MVQVNKVVELTFLEHGAIAIVKLQDEESKNTFSYPIIEGLVKAFETVEKSEHVKVAVVHGYDNYFCCGGTKEELVKIFEGEATFADLGFYRLLIECPVPTISAMQGHALGGGLAFGALADLMVLAEEALYGANFMKYGFTPGMGSTMSLPLKFGQVLGTEMLFSAKLYHGGELRARGAGPAVVPREKVVQVAVGLARELAEKPALSLRLLKAHLAEPIRRRLTEAADGELKMHESSFKQPEVRERIERLFNN